MSQERDSSPSRTLLQAENQNQSESAKLERELHIAKLRHYNASANFWELLVVLLTSAAAKMLGRRAVMLAEGGYLPGMADARGIGALANRPESGIESVISKEPRAKFHVGRQPFYKLSDFATYGAGDEDAESPPNDAPVMRKEKGKK